MYEIDLSKVRATVAFTHLPDNTRTIDEVVEVEIGQVVIESCTNGRISDLRVARDILKGNKFHEKVKCIVFSETQKIYL